MPTGSRIENCCVCHCLKNLTIIQYNRRQYDICRDPKTRAWQQKVFNSWLCKEMFDMCPDAYLARDAMPSERRRYWTRKNK